MEDNDSKSFRIRFDDDESIQPVRRDDVRNNLLLKKLSQRLTIISVLIPCLIAVIITVVFINLNKKISGIQDSGSVKVQSLSKDLEEKLTALSGKTDQLKALIENQSEQFEKKLTYVSKDLGKNKNSLQKSVEAKANKNDLRKYNKEITGKVEDLKKNINTFSSELKALDSSLNNKIENALKGLADSVDGITKDVNRLNQEMSQLSDTGIDRKQLDFSLDLQAKRYKTELRQAIAELEKRIDASRKEIENQKPTRKDSIKNTKDSLKIPLSKPDSSPESEKAQPKGDEIIEQDISE